MNRVNLSRHQTTLDLVHALGTGLKSSESLLETILYGLVIAQFKMKAVVKVVASPVAPVQVIAPLEAQGCSHNLRLLSHKDTGHWRQCGAQAVKNLF